MCGTDDDTMDVSTWAMDTFKAGINRCQWSWQKKQEPFRASVDKCEMKEGHVSVAMVRGKKLIYCLRN